MVSGPSPEKTGTVGEMTQMLRGWHHPEAPSPKGWIQWGPLTAAPIHDLFSLEFLTAWC